MLYVGQHLQIEWQNVDGAPTIQFPQPCLSYIYKTQKQFLIIRNFSVFMRILPAIKQGHKSVHFKASVNQLDDLTGLGVNCL